MKYILLIPIISYYIFRDIAVLIKHGDLLRGILLLLLLFLTLLFFSAWLNIVREASRVRKQIGPGVYDWLSGGQR